MAVTLIVEGPSEVAFFAGLDRRITELSSRRNLYSRAHELAHHALEMIATGANDTGMAVFETPIKPQWTRDEDKPSLWPPFTPLKLTVVTADYFSQCMLPTSRPLRLPTWCTNTFVGLPAPTWTSSGNALDRGLPPAPAGQDVGLVRSKPPWVTVRIAAGSGQLVTDLTDSLLRLLAFLRSMVRLFDRAIEAACVIRLIVRSGLRQRPNGLAFALIILGTCRRYGRRSEPDDHASLLNRRHLVSTGSCPQA